MAWLDSRSMSAGEIQLYAIAGRICQKDLQLSGERHFLTRKRNPM
jgi:hypothetical protein